MHRRLAYWLPILVGAVLLSAAALLMAEKSASAQCGSQASSCKNCHEVKAEDQVNADGTGWHQSHAFGDFCAFCHAGNVQATDKTEAHTGMVPPLADIDAACASCHAGDTKERAQVYATALGITLVGDAGGGASSGGAGGDSGQSAPPSSAPPAEAGQQQAAPVEGAPGLVIDYYQQYEATAQGNRPVNWGNMLLVVLVFALIVGGGAFVFLHERKLRNSKLQVPSTKLQTSDSQTAATIVAAETKEAASQSPLSNLQSPLFDLLPALERLDPRGLRALRKILTNAESASDLLHAVSRIDPQLIEEVRRLDRRELNLLIALAGEG